MKKAVLLVLVASIACTQTKQPSRTVALPTFGPGGSYRPQFDASRFSVNVTNAWFPLTVGTTMTYQGVRDGAHAREIVVVTSNTKTIDGVVCRVLSDKLYLDGTLAEQTLDYYSQDDAGNVWYFGEDTAEIEDGKVVSREGTWHAGVDGAQPGVYMPAAPAAGTRFRQEYLKGHAEDTFTIAQLDASVRVPYGSFTGALRTEETTDLEPGVVDNKFYVRGVGEVKELAVKGGDEHLELISVQRV